MDLLQSFGIEGKLLLWQVINFGVLLVVLWYVLYKPLRKVMHDREHAVRQSLQRAETLERESKEKQDSLRQEMETQRKELADVHTQALAQQETMRKEMKTRAEEDARKIVDDARRAVAAEKASILTSLEGDVKSLAVELAGKILEKEVDPKTEEKLLNDALRAMRGHMQ